MQRTKTGIFANEASAVAFDGVSSLTKDQFCTMLDKTLPRGACAPACRLPVPPRQTGDDSGAGRPFDLGLIVACVHLLLFVHRLTGLEPGLYFLLRAERDLPACAGHADRPALQQKCHRHFLWRPVDEALPLYLLQAGDFQSTATSVSCHQSIGGDGAFMARKKWPPFPQAAASLLPLFPDFYAGGVGGVGVFFSRWGTRSTWLALC